MCIVTRPATSKKTSKALAIALVFVSACLASCSSNDQRETEEQRYAELEKKQLENLDQRKRERRRQLGETELNPVLLTEAERKQKKLDDRYNQALERAASRATNSGDTSDSASTAALPEELSPPAAEQEWRTVTIPDPLTSKSQCSVVSNPRTYTDIGLEATIEIIVAKTAVFVTSDVPFDEDALIAGFRIDSRRAIRFDRYEQNTAVIDRSYEKLITQLLTGKLVIINFSSLTGEDTSIPIMFEFDLASFDEANQALYRCKRNTP